MIHSRSPAGFRQGGPIDIRVKAARHRAELLQRPKHIGIAPPRFRSGRNPTKSGCSRSYFRRSESGHSPRFDRPAVSVDNFSFPEKFQTAVHCLHRCRRRNAHHRPQVVGTSAHRTHEFGAARLNGSDEWWQ